jgi:hypothetical protein
VCVSKLSLLTVPRTTRPFWTVPWVNSVDLFGWLLFPVRSFLFSSDIRFLIGWLDAPMMEAAGMAGNGHSRMPRAPA